ncbi:MAG: hypothetical protein ACI81S_002125 [Sphingobacteriales bacterium]|jgi:hypothetical protein
MTTNTRSNVFRYGDAGNLSAPGNERDYHVLEMTKQPRSGQLDFGKSMSFRYFYVLGSTTLAAQNLILQENLVKNSLDTAYIPQKLEVDSLDYIVIKAIQPFP